MLGKIALKLGIGLMACAPLMAAAQAQHATIVVPAAAGGGADVLARVVAAKLQPIIDKTIVVENRPGANSAIGISAVSRAKPDGTTMLLVDRTTTVVNPLRLSNLPYDPDGLQPVSDIAKLDFLFVVGSDAPFKTWDEMVEYARSNPGKVAVGNSGVGSGAHLSTELLGRHLGIEFVNVPYKGMSPALQDVMGGVIDALIAGPTVVLPQMDSGKIRVLAQGSDERSAQFPDVPTLREVGIAEPLLLPVPFTVFVPGGTPAETVDSLNAALRQVTADEEVLERFEAMGLVPVANSPADVQQDSAELKERLDIVIRETGLRE